MTPLRSARNILVCRPQTPNEPISVLDAQVCPGSGNARFKLEMTPAYVAVDGEPQRPLDYAQSGVFWTLALTTVVGLWFVSAHVGAFLGFVRRG